MKIKDTRKPFEDALTSFRKFVSTEDMPTSFLWITQDRVRVVGGRIWIFRPSELLGDEGARRFYESVRFGDSSIKLLGIDKLEGRYVTCVEEMPAPPHEPNQLYMSLHKNPTFSVCGVSSQLLWTLLGSLSALSKRDRLIRDSIALLRTIKLA